MSAGLGERLKRGTGSLHAEVEASVFMHALIHGRVTQPAYGAFLRNLQPIYVALETALVGHASHPSIAPLLAGQLQHGLFRAVALTHDLEALLGAGWADAAPALPSCTRYVYRIHEIEVASPELLVAHAYVRYLGDLSGGQMLSRVVGRTITPVAGAGSGLEFYDFGDAQQTARLTDAFRAAIELVPGDGSEQAPIVAEAVAAFELHRSLFDELDRAGLSPPPVKRPD